MAIITKYSDYVIHSIEYFITQIETELDYRDIEGLSNGKIQKINITKEHPLAALMTASLSETRNNDILRSGIIPAISVTPGNMADEGFTLGMSYKPEIVDDDFIDILKLYLEKTNKEIQNDVLITPTQIDTIISEYNKTAETGLRVQANEWHKNEDINISVWSDSPDIDILLGNLMDSTLAFIKTGFVGDESRIRNFKYTVTKGLINFNFGRTLFGSEYGLTFLNTFNNYTIYTDDVLSGHDFVGTYQIPEEA